MVSLSYLGKRLGLMVVSLYAVITILFFLFRILPGDPTSRVVSPRFSAEQQEQLMAQYGLDEPLHTQYILYMRNFAVGDLGQSFQHGEPVLPFILDRTINTLILTVPAILIAFILGPFIGALFAWHRNGRLDNYGTAIALTTYAAPIFWTGMIALMIFSFTLNILPSGGMRPAGDVPGTAVDRVFSLVTWQHAILPIVIFALWRISRPILITRNTMIDVLGDDFIQLKKAEGTPESTIRYRHAMRNSLLPVVHYGALAIGYAFGGSVILETVFSWPGLGRTMWDAVQAHDYPVVQGAFFLMSFMVILFNFIADIVSSWLDPRVKDEGVVE
ncbi:ABC transporter permease [Natrarchaeobius oligotrophus]|uniref:ABC transporter permease n=1 Tax=Natrarchaeobius chitinivorans TaxID=1679083 RepID=A0A3N6MX90_NATCH|nr:ABC transporter permease [Natrarchaeobius chitinivorans]RQH02631.1 ABC transporter permease [Natrarchaeobius chitinivorans]